MANVVFFQNRIVSRDKQSSQPLMYKKILKSLFFLDLPPKFVMLSAA